MTDEEEALREDLAALLAALKAEHTALARSTEALGVKLARLRRVRRISLIAALSGIMYLDLALIFAVVSWFTDDTRLLAFAGWLTHAGQLCLAAVAIGGISTAALMLAKAKR